MHEIPQIGDEVTVLRDGRLVATVPADTPESKLVELMTGRALSDVYPASVPVAAQAPVRLALRGVSTADGSVLDANLEVRAGEIVASPAWSAAARANSRRRASACSGSPPANCWSTGRSDAFATRPTRSPAASGIRRPIASAAG